MKLPFVVRWRQVSGMSGGDINVLSKNIWKTLVDFSLILGRGLYQKEESNKTVPDKTPELLLPRLGLTSPKLQRQD